jgi:hypothetical protein
VVASNAQRVVRWERASRWRRLLDERGVPRAVGATPAADGLRFIGFVPRPGGIGYMANEAKRASRAIARELRRARRS